MLAGEKFREELFLKTGILPETANNIQSISLIC